MAFYSERIYLPRPFLTGLLEGSGVQTHLHEQLHPLTLSQAFYCQVCSLTGRKPANINISHECLKELEIISGLVVCIISGKEARAAE